MKKIFIITILASLIAFSGFAQKGTLGLKIGYSNTNYSGPDQSRTYPYKARSGFHGGLSFNSKPGKYIWLKHDFFIHTKGGKSVYPRTNKSYTYRDYCAEAMPLSIAGHYKGFQVFVGPYVHLVLLEQVIEKTGSEVDTIVVASDDWYNPLDYGIVAGLEYEFKFGLNLGVRYQRGFASIYGTNENILASIGNQTRVFNRALMFSLGFSFGAKKSNEE